MKKLIQLSIALIPTFVAAQFEFNNQGDIYLQKGAMIHVQGEFTNDRGIVLNDGIIEVDGDFNNKAGSAFAIGNDNSSKERAVKFTGNGTQAIKGDMTNASFYNLVIDKASATDAVEMQTNVNVDGSLVFGSNTTAATYATANTYSNNNQKGLIQTYSGANEFVLSVRNGNNDAVAGYATMNINGAPTTAYIVTKGTRGTNTGGFERNVNSATAYDFPIGTEENGYNAVRMNFSHIPANGGMVKGKFNDGTDNASGYAGFMTQECKNCTAENTAANNNGYNRYFAANPCKNNQAQSISLENNVTDHGYWSFSADANSNAYEYMVETFPNSFTHEGAGNDIMRTVKYDAAFGYNPSNESWNQFVESVANVNDLLEYSRNTGTCYNGTGIPGGKYTGITTHFAMRSGKAQPVEIVFIKAEPKQNNIEVSWATALEINNHGFEVKRSTDGVNFTTIGWVEGNGNSITEKNYLFVDNTADANTVYFYQLNQLDFDGASAKTNIVSAEIVKGISFSISELMPNPAYNASQLVITSGVAQDISVRMIDMIGQVVSNVVYPIHTGVNAISLDISLFASGSYHAVVTADGKSISKKLIVTNE